MPTSTLTTKNRFSARAPVRRVRDLKGGRRAVPYIPGKLKDAPPRPFHHAAAFAQSDAPAAPPAPCDPRRPRRFTPSAQRHLVAILQETSHLAGGQIDRLRPAPCGFQ